MKHVYAMWLKQVSLTGPQLAKGVVHTLNCAKAAMVPR